MGVSSVHVLHGIKTPSNFYTQVEEATPSPGASVILGASAGHIQPLFRGIPAYKPSVGFKTTQLATLLAEAGLYGVALTGNTDCLYRKTVAFGTREALASTVHTQIRLHDAFLSWRGLTARHQGIASIDAVISALFDGTNAPMAATAGVALTGNNPAAGEYFALGPVSVNGSVLTGVQEASIDMGIEYIEAGSASEAYPSFIAVRAVNPTITLRGLDLGWGTYGATGTALSACIVYLRKLTADGNYVADATAQHIKFTGTNGLITIDSTGGGGNGEATTGLKLSLRAANATAEALTVSTASAIT